LILYPATVFNLLVQTMFWYSPKKRHIVQWKRIERPQINPHIYGQVRSQRSKNIKLGKESLQ